MQENNDYPKWFNKIAHLTNAVIVGAVLGIFIFSGLQNKSINEFSGQALGTLIGAGSIYGVARVVYLLNKKFKKS